MPPDRARAFAPGGTSFDRTQKLVQALCRDPISVELEVLIDQNAYPPFFLRAKGGRALGEDVFLSSRRRTGGVLRRVFDLEDVSGGRKSKRKPDPSGSGTPGSGTAGAGKPAPAKAAPGKSAPAKAAVAAAPARPAGKPGTTKR